MVLRMKKFVVLLSLFCGFTFTMLFFTKIETCDSTPELLKQYVNNSQIVTVY